MRHFTRSWYCEWKTVLEKLSHTFPERKVVPEVGCSSPEINLSIVDFPIPFGPTTEIFSPRSQCKHEIKVKENGLSKKRRKEAHIFNINIDFKEYKLSS